MGPHPWHRIHPVRKKILAIGQTLRGILYAYLGGTKWPIQGRKSLWYGGTFCAGILLGGVVFGWTGLPRIDPSGERIFLPPAESSEEGGLFRAAENVALLLQPGQVVAPIGTEVILVATVLGPDQFTSTNERVEWSIAPGSVGEFVRVGKGSWLNWLVLDFTRPRKVCNTFAITSTLRRYVRLTRGTPQVQDDVTIQPGQAWVSVSSPMEGTTYVSAYAPSVAGWSRRRQTAVIHWVDVQWTFPAPAINPAGSRHIFTTTVTGRSDGRPRQGWLVRYEILDGPPAGFMPDGAKVAEVATNEAGQASVEIFQPQPAAGTNRIQIQILRPSPGGGPESSRLILASGITTKTWSAPQLTVRKQGPQEALAGSEIKYIIEVRNSGDLLAEGVQLQDQIPQGATLLSTHPPAQPSSSQLQWDLGRLGPGEIRQVEVRLRADRPGVWNSCAEAFSAQGLRARQCVQTRITQAESPPPFTGPSAGELPSVQLEVSGPNQATVGQQVRFDLVLRNRGSRHLTGLVIRDRFAPGLRHEAAPAGVIERLVEQLPAGSERRFHVIFQVVQPGRVCHTIEVYSGSQLLASRQACLEAQMPPGQGPSSLPGQTGGGASAGLPPAGGTPSQPSPQPKLPTAPSKQPSAAGQPSPLQLRSWAEPAKATVGQRVLITTEIQNVAKESIRGLQVRVGQDPGLRPKRASEGFRLQGQELVLTLEQLWPGQPIRVQVEYECLQPGPELCVRTQVVSLQGVQGRAEICVQVEPAPTTSLRPPELSIRISDLKDPVVQGEQLAYLIRITNQGQKPDFQLIVTARLSPELIANRIGTSGPAPYEIQGQQVRFGPVSQIRPGETLTYRIVSLAQGAGEAQLTVEVQSQGLSQPQSIVEKTTIRPTRSDSSPAKKAQPPS